MDSRYQEVKDLDNEENEEKVGWKPFVRQKKMDSRYQEVKDLDNEENEEKVGWKPFLRQLFICSNSWLIYFLTGLSFGIPTVMIPQEKVEETMASWLSSIFGYSAIPWVVIICVTTRKIGRKLPFSIVCLNTLIYNLVLYFSVTTTQVLISELMQGINHASNMTLSVIIVSEYTSPKYRGIFLAVKSASIFWGIWVANAIGTFAHWKYIPLLGIFLSFYTATVLLWPESPQWLASVKRFEDCKRAHRWLRGEDKNAEKELEKLIHSQLDLKRNRIRKSILIEARKTVTCKAFYKPLLLSVVMMMQYQFSGKIVCMVYAIEIIKKITANESTAYLGMLILDGVTVSGMYLGCVLARVLKRRSLLFISSAIGITFLYLISVYLHLIEKGVLVENGIATIALLICFSVSISCGPLILSTSIYAELIPLRFKSFCMMASALMFVSLTSTLLKIFPYICKHFNMSGAFLFYALTSTVCALISFVYLPETKDRSLQEIEDLFDDKSKNDEDTELTESELA